MKLLVFCQIVFLQIGSSYNMNASLLQNQTSMKACSDKFPKTDAGLVVTYLGGMATGILVTSVIFVLYIRWIKEQSSKQANTYLDLSVDNEEEKPAEYKQRGSVAFVREIASVYYSVGEEKIDLTGDRSTTSRSGIFSWSSKSRKSIQDRQSGLNKLTNDKTAIKTMFSYEQPVPEELNDYLDLDTSTTPAKHMKCENEIVKAVENCKAQGTIDSKHETNLNLIPSALETEVHMDTTESGTD